MTIIIQDWHFTIEPGRGDKLRLRIKPAATPDNFAVDLSSEEFASLVDFINQNSKPERKD